jgi:hypothetical protein
MSFTKLLEFIAHEHTKPIGTKGLQLGLGLNLGRHLHDHERLKTLIYLHLQQHNPDVCTEVINNEH